MRGITIYECQVCGKRSETLKEIEQCVAAHFGLTIEEYKEWKKLTEDFRHKSWVITITNNEETRTKQDKALAELLLFEKEHHIDTYK